MAEPLEVSDALSSSSQAANTPQCGFLGCFPMLSTYNADHKQARAAASFPLLSECKPIAGVPPDRMPVLDRIGSRGFTVEALLEFLCFLLDRDRALLEIDGMREAFRDFAHFHSPESMPNMNWFDPKGSTTYEVAYKAVVPLSKHAKTAFQPIMMKGRSLYPKAIITHSWSSVFTHTVAACVADALNKPYYFCILPKLREYDRVRALIRELRNEGIASHSYWLCLLSINQHMIACHTEGCDCGLPKLTDDKNPDCEIGHFHWMMRFLVSKHGDFYQVIAFDRYGRVLTRVWVVAEINEVQQASLRQQIKFHVPLNVAGRGIQRQMRKIDVQACEATRREDKKMILACIPDKDKYNQDLRGRLVLFVRRDFSSYDCLFRLNAIYAILIMLLPSTPYYRLEDLLCGWIPWDFAKEPWFRLLSVITFVFLMYTVVVVHLKFSHIEQIVDAMSPEDMDGCKPECVDELSSYTLSPLWRNVWYEHFGIAGPKGIRARFGLFVFRWLYFFPLGLNAVILLRIFIWNSSSGILGNRWNWSFLILPAVGLCNNCFWLVCLCAKKRRRRVEAESRDALGKLSVVDSI